MLERCIAEAKNTAMSFKINCNPLKKYQKLFTEIRGKFQKSQASFYVEIILINTPSFQNLVKWPRILFKFRRRPFETSEAPCWPMLAGLASVNGIVRTLRKETRTRSSPRTIVTSRAETTRTPRLTPSSPALNSLLPSRSLVDWTSILSATNSRARMERNFCWKIRTVNGILLCSSNYHSFVANTVQLRVERSKR